MSGGNSRSKKTSKRNTGVSLEGLLKIPSRPKNDVLIEKGFSYIDDLEKYKFPDYSNEVKNYLENKSKEDNDESKEKIFVTPFTNHEYALSQALEALASNKPYVALIGETGIDKMKMSKYLAEVLASDNLKFKEFDSEIVDSLLNIAPSKKEYIDSLLSTVRSKIKDRFYSYIFLPNLGNIHDVYVLSYNSDSWIPSKEYRNDSAVAQKYLKEFTSQVDNLTRSLVRNIKNPQENSSGDKPDIKEEKLPNKIINLFNNLSKKKSELLEKYAPTNELTDWIKSVELFFSRGGGRAALADGIEDVVTIAKNAKEDGSGIDTIDKTVYMKKGPDSFDIKELFNFNKINPNSANQKISYITQYEKTIFASFQPEGSDDIPHMNVLNIGKFFASPITVIPHLRELISAVSDGDGYNYVKPKLLQGLDTGKYLLNNGGMNFLLKSERTLIGFDNVDPFLVLKTGGVEEDESEFRNKFKTIDVFWYIDNTSTSRKKTLAIIDSFLDDFNTKNNKKISFSEDGYNTILQSLVMPSLEIANTKLINSEYSDLEKNVHNIALYASANNLGTIDKKLILKKKMDDIPPTYFSNIDSEDRYGWLLSDPKKIIGALNGITVWDDTSCQLFKTRSYAYRTENFSRKEHIIELLDTKHRMGDESASKGQELASDAIHRLLQKYGHGTKYDSFILRTYFKDEWDPNWAGPSGSFAVGLSMLSAFTNTEVYQNRVVTGTLDPVNLQAQKIGWPYFKSLSVFRLDQLDKSRDWYFIFPAQNVHDMTKLLTQDPFEMSKNVNLLPVKTFEEAYHLMTCGDRITQYDRKYAHELGVNKIIQQLNDGYVIDTYGSKIKK